MDIQKKKVDTDEKNARSRAKKVEHAMLAEEVQIMTTDLSTLTPRKSAWYEKKQMVYGTR